MRRASSAGESAASRIAIAIILAMLPIARSSSAVTIDERVLDPDPQARKAALAKLDSRAKERLIPMLVSTLKTGDGDLPTRAGYALIEIGTATVPSLAAVLEENEAESFRRVTWVLSNFGSGAKAVAPVLVRMAGDPDVTMRTDVYYALQSIDPATAAAIEWPKHVDVREERGYRLTSEFLDLATPVGKYRLTAPSGRIILEGDAGGAVAVDVPFNRDPRGIFLDDHPDIVALGLPQGGNHGACFVSLYRVGESSAARIAEYTAGDGYVGRLEDLSGGALPEIVSLKTFWGLWGGMSNSPSVVTIFALDPASKKYVHAEKRLHSQWQRLAEESEREAAARGASLFDPGGPVFRAVEALVMRSDEVFARAEFGKAYELARHNYPGSKLPEPDEAWENFLAQVAEIRGVSPPQRRHLWKKARMKTRP